MSGLALLNMGTAASRPALAGDPAQPLLRFAGAFNDAGIAAALFLWGAATWWLVVAVVSGRGGEGRAIWSGTCLKSSAPAFPPLVFLSLLCPALAR